MRRGELQEALRNAGVPDDLFALPPVRGPRVWLESYFFLVERPGGFLVGIFERGTERIGYRSRTEEEASRHLYEELVFTDPAPRKLTDEEERQAKERTLRTVHEIGAAGVPAGMEYVLGPGLIVDQFGQESGTFLYPDGTPMEQRSLPPSILNTTDPRFPYGYHRYEVIREFRVRAGVVAPAFEQPGGGVQFKAEPVFLPEAPPLLSILWLLRNGYLSRIAAD